MADYFDTAGQNIDQGKAALLSAIGQYGSQAQQAMKAAQDQIASQKQAAIQAALSAAQQRNAPQAEQDAVTSTISAPYDQRLTNLSQSAASRQAGFDQQASGVGNYFDEAKASVPALRTQLAQKVATLQAQANNQLAAAQAKSEQQALANELANARLQYEQNRLDQQSQPSSLSKIISNLGGAENAGALVSGPLADATDQANRQAFIGQPEDQFDPAQRVGDQVGLPGAVVSDLSGRYAATQQTRQTAEAKAANPDLASIGSKVGLSVAGVQKMMGTPEWDKANQLAELYVQQGKTLDDLKVALGSAQELANKPKTRDAIIELYRGQLVSPNYIPTKAGAAQ